MLGAGADSFTTRGGAIIGVVDGGDGVDALTFDIAGTAAYDVSQFTSFESWSKTGIGTLTLNGSISYPGANAIMASVLAGRVVGSATSLQGNITNDAELEFAQTTDGSYIDIVSGSGQLTRPVLARLP